MTDLLADAPALPATSAPKRRRCRRYNGKSNGKARLLTLSDLDKRTAAAQIALQLVEAISADLGGDLSQCQMQLVRRAACLAAYLESCEVRWLKGEAIELLDYLSAVNTQRRVLQDLGLQRVPRNVSPTLEQYAAMKVAAE